MRTRTSNLLIRSQVLYPIELWARRRDAQDRTRTCTPSLALVPQTSLSTNFSTWAPSNRRHCAKLVSRRSGPETAAQPIHRVTNSEDTARRQYPGAAV